jgi:arylesterase / paraoxonase
VRRALLVAVVLGLAVAAWLVETLWVGGYWRDVGPHFAGTCRAIEGIPGPEDLTIHPRTGIAYVSSSDRRAAAAGRAPHGAIYALDLAEAAPVPRNLTPDAGPDFDPLGISLLLGTGGPDLLFVVNNARGRHTIEEYAIEADRLVHRRTLADPLLRSPNDVVAVAPDLLYVTNDHGWPAGFGRTLEEWLRLPVSDVVMWDGHGFRVAASGIRFPNGINRSPDGATIYVASSTGRELRVYARDPATGALTLGARLALGTTLDNIEVAADGSLWLAGHPNVFALMAHRDGAPAHSPSQVLHAVPLADGGFRVDEVFLDPGERACSSTVAAVRGDRLLIGDLFEPRVVDCRLPR